MDRVKEQLDAAYDRVMAFIEGIPDMADETAQDRVKRALENPAAAAEPVSVKHVQVSAGDLVDLLRQQAEGDADLTQVLKGNEKLEKDRLVYITADLARRLAGGGQQQEAAPETAPARRGKQQPEA